MKLIHFILDPLYISSSEALCLIEHALQVGYEEYDVEIFFANKGTSGTVSVLERVSVRIEIITAHRPAALLQFLTDPVYSNIWSNNLIMSKCNIFFREN